MRITDKQFAIACVTVLLVIATLSKCAHAAEVSVVAHTVSYHFSNDHSLNSVNLGVGIRMREGAWAIQSGIFRNSHKRNSAYGLIDWQPLAWKNVTAGAFIGTANGYLYHNGAYVPVAGAVANLSIWRGNDVRIRFVPAYREINAAMVALEFGHAFNF